MQTSPFQTPWTKERILALLYNQQNAVERALLALYSRQEADEQQARETLKCNAVGFNAADARTLSGYASKILGGTALTPVEVNDARQRIVKYVGQLLEIALAKQTEQQLAALTH